MTRQATTRLAERLTPCWARRPAHQIQGPAGYGATGPLVKALTIDLGVHDGNFSGSGTFNMTQMADLTDEKYYVNIPSTLFTGGEIRGQIRLAAVPEPGTIVLLACGSLALAATAWRRRRRTSAG